MFFTIPAIIIDVCLMIFFTIHRKRKMVVDTSYLKTILLLLGALLYFVSLNFNRFSDYTNCSINFIFKHGGLILFYIICIVYISTNIELGLDITIQNTIRMRQFKYISSTTSTKLSNDINSGNNMVIKSNATNVTANTNYTNSSAKDEISVNSIDAAERKMRESLASGGSKSTIIDEEKEKEDNYEAVVRLDKNIAVVHSLNFEFIFIYVLIFILFAVVIVVFKGRDNNKYLQDYDKRWRYECPLNQFNMALNMTELLLIIYLMTKVKKIWNYTLVFKYTRNISYMTVIWIALGPFVNVSKEEKKNFIFYIL